MDPPRVAHDPVTPPLRSASALLELAAVNVVLAGEHSVRALHSLGDVHHLLDDDGLVTY